MQRRRIGTIEVSALGLGCMGMSEFYGPSDRERCLDTLSHALDLGIDFWDTADVYGRGDNERLVGRALQGRRDRVVLASKFGLLRDDQGRMIGVDGSPDYVRSACEASLSRLGVDHIDLYYQHRVDQRVPIEDTVGAMARLVEEGKVRRLGLSEASAETVKRAQAIHPICALQTEYSLWERGVENTILPTCTRLGIGLVAYSPLGRGLLGGSIRTLEALSEDDARRKHPRYQGENLERNLELVDTLRRMSADLDCTPAQLALAWLLDRGEHVVPIPGTRSRARLAENAAATLIDLDADDREHLDQAFADQVAGARYPAATMALIDGRGR